MELEEVRIENIEFTVEESEMFDLEVEDNHNFFIEGGFLTHNSLNLLKAATETEKAKILTKSNYSTHQEDLPDYFECHSRLIFDYNKIQEMKLRDDFEALVSRGDFEEFYMSEAEISSVMRLIAKTDKEKMITEFIIKNFQANGLFRLNLRTQYKAFKTYGWAVRNELNWKEELIEELKNVSPIRSLLYSLIGPKKVKRTELKKRLLKHQIVSTMKTADRRINDWLFIDELFKVSMDERDYFVCINENQKAQIEAKFEG